MGCAVRPAGTQRAAGRGTAQDLVTVLKVGAAVPGSLTPPGPGSLSPSGLRAVLGRASRRPWRWFRPLTLWSARVPRGLVGILIL